MKNILLIITLLYLPTCFATNAVITSVLVKKSEKKMYLLADTKTVKEYRVVFGAKPVGHKEKEGDERTPEGKYILDYKNENSEFYKAIHISYPNEQDKENAKRKGVAPGGSIMIHGQKNGFGRLSSLSQWFNWTNGCIAVTNSEMDEIWGLVKVGTEIEILP